ncbi:MAG TPA: hypothetical protein DIC32_04440 [Acinetobacter radioresistens]|uniref:YqaJ viral recombinase domain-containing protein n=1 Tax=Acinetobacter radioresistens TaxID=40216 RepID=A0A3D3G049_ACIRA|nr:hypothetical protein [Acinetobacter radioresistens]
MQILNFQQGSAEWLQARAGLITCSELESVFSKGKGKEVFGKAAITYMYELIGEQITGEPKQSYSGFHTERGHSHEPLAIELYQLQHDVEIESCGFIVGEKVGYSPDGLIGLNGLTEIKSKLPKFQAQILYECEIPGEHYMQCMGGLWVAEREWIDFISYCPSMPIFIKRLYRDEKVIQEIKDRVELFLEELECRKQKIMGLAA